MFTLRHNLEMFFIVTLGTALSLFVLVQRNNNNNPTSFSLSASVLTISIPSPTTAPGPIQTSSMGSPDGTKNLTMNKQVTKGKTKYSFYTSTPDGLDKLIFTKELSEGESISIPYNTWSPDNTYFFLDETTSSTHNYYVLNASGNLLKGDAKYANIQELFSQKQPDYTITEVTGWADPNLVIVNTKLNKDDRKVSFWFEVSSQTFITLSTYFN